MVCFKKETSQLHVAKVPDSWQDVLRDEIGVIVWGQTVKTLKPLSECICK